MNILQRWALSENQIDQLLALGTADGSDSDRSAGRLTVEQRRRVCYVLSIHAVLRSVFTNPDNVYGFMNSRNRNMPFDGRTPLSLLLSEPAEFELVFSGLNGLVSGY